MYESLYMDPEWDSDSDSEDYDYEMDSDIFGDPNDDWEPIDRDWDDWDPIDRDGDDWEPIDKDWDHWEPIDRDWDHNASEEEYNDPMVRPDDGDWE